MPAVYGGGYRLAITWSCIQVFICILIIIIITTVRLVPRNKREWTQVDIEVHWTYRDIYICDIGIAISR